MSENEDSNEGKTLWGVIGHLAEGGLPSLFLSKPVQQAIGRLVFAAADIPVAKLEQWAQNIRLDTIKKKEIVEVIASRAKKVAGSDKDLVDRGIERWTNQLKGRQRARENVAVRTLSLLSNEHCPPHAAAPSPEFMGLFEDIAEAATSHELADLLARILAGEIRKPKSVSRRTLQVAAVLDAEIVAALALVRSNLLTPNWIHIPPSKSADWRGALSLLESVSITNMAGPRGCADAGKTTSFVLFRDDGIVLTLKPGLFPWMIDGANLTPIGMELISVLPLSQDVTVAEIGRGFKEHGDFITRVQVGKAWHKDNKIGVTDLDDV